MTAANPFLVLPLFITLSLALIAGPHSFIGKCLTVLDGDTVDVSKDGSPLRVRLEGIDCPERDQPFAEQAKAFTANLIAGKTVTIIEKEKDTYGRTVARIFVDGRDVSVELLKAGLATHYKQYSSDWLLATLEQQAKADRVGMWASPTPATQVEESSSLPVSGASNAPGRASQTVYHGNTSSRIFHSPSCRNFNCKNCTREFRSREEAVAAGFRPCGICRP